MIDFKTVNMALVKSVVALALGFIAVDDAGAANGSWGNSGPHPAIYQTNYWYNMSGPINSLIGTSTSAKISGANVRWGYNSLPYNSRNPSSWTVQAKICTSGKCGYTTTQVSNDTYWNGLSAGASWTFSFIANSSQTKVFANGPLNGSQNVNLSVNYIQ
ncbi:hypothetical protein [Methylobacterium aquaticum]|uniref:hypothetical protein n=1 Tax=Methylobacterium aquaticum TaxID=270351 RepID=UPI001933728A|nr:hypothetical protein [Methylobacterium aquaticum]QRE76195.1 hypothetical protein F1D61_23860 [Methylobacterium aquaticum]